MPLPVLHPNIQNDSYVSFVIGKSLSVNECGYFWYRHPGTCGFGIRGTTDVFTFTNSAVNFPKPVTINNLTVNSKLTINNSTDLDMIYSSLSNSSVSRIAIGKSLSNLKCSYFFILDKMMVFIQFGKRRRLYLQYIKILYISFFILFQK
mgnify:CR=1 FL=1